MRNYPTYLRIVTPFFLTATMALEKIFLLSCFVAALSTQPQLVFGRSVQDVSSSDEVPNAFVILGASGDLAKRKIYPSLWALYRDNLLPPKTRIFGYALSQMTVADLRARTAPHVAIQPSEERLYDEFWGLHYYVNGTKNPDADYDEVNRVLEEHEENGRGNRVFYLALPPAVFPSAASQIKRACVAKDGYTRLVVEKPFGRDSASSQQLSDHLTKLFREDQLYRMDHFLGYEMTENIVPLRFANRLLEEGWDRDSIAAIEIDFKENFGVEGRGGYFDDNGIIRDVVQNHLLQIASLIGMERPASNHADDVRDAKVDFLKSTKSVVLDDVVIGQYIGNPDSEDPRERIGYTEDPTVAKDSIASTFSLTVLRVDNERWNGVPFIIRAGKGLNINRTEIIVQYKDVENDIFNNQAKRNKLHIRLEQGEALQAKMMVKTPGISSDIEEISVNFDYRKAFKDPYIPSAYERLILDVFEGSQLNFVRSDELSEAWRIFTPILHEIEGKKIRPIKYKFGSTGPIEADQLEKKNNFF